MMRCRPAIKFSLAVTITTLLGSAQVGSAQAEDLALKEATSSLGWIAIQVGAPGLVLGVVRGEESIVQGFGETRRGSKGGAQRPFHSAPGLARQGHDGPGPREHGRRRHCEARRSARQICAPGREGACGRG
jgi:hypothetical protein